jgi:predicted Zn-dependent protease
LLIKTLVVLAVAAAGAFGLRAWQVGRNATAILATAEESAAAGDYKAAMDTLYRYVQIRPDDPVGRLRLAEVVDRIAQGEQGKSRAIELYSQALGVAAPEKQSEIGCRLAELHNELGRYGLALDDAEEKALKAVDDAPDAALWRAKATEQRAIALYGQYRTRTLKTKEAGVGDAFEQAKAANDQARAALQGKADKDPQDEQRLTALALSSVGIAVRRAQIHREERRLLPEAQTKLAEDRAKCEAAGDRIMNEMVAANAKLAEAYLARYRYRVKYALPDSRGDLDKAIQSGPDNVEVLLAAAEGAKDEGSRKPPTGKEAADLYKKARSYYIDAVKAAPGDCRAYLGLGDVQWALGERQAAIDTWRQCQTTSVLGGWYINARLARGAIAFGRLNEAEQRLKVLELLLDREVKPRNQLQAPEKANLEREYELLRADWLRRKGDPGADAAVRKIGSSLTSGLTVGNQEEKAAAQTWVNLAELQAGSGKRQEAIRAYGEAVKHQPSAALAWVKLAELQAGLGRRPEAIKALEEAAKHQPSAATYILLARIRFLEQCARPKGSRDWEAFTKVLALAQAAVAKENPHQDKTQQDKTQQDKTQQDKTQQDSVKQRGGDEQAQLWDLRLLEAEHQLVRDYEEGRGEQATAEALKRLQELEQQVRKDGINGRVFTRLAMFYERLGQPDDAERAVAEVGKSGDVGNACLLRAGLAASRRLYAAASQILLGGLKTVPDAMVPELQQQLVRVDLLTGNVDAAAKRFFAIDVGRADFGLLCHLAELCLDSGKLAEAEQCEVRLHTIEGDEGVLWKICRARRLLALASKADDPQVGQAEKIVDGLKKQYPKSAAVRAMEAEILALRGNLDEAIQAYRDAVHQGEQRLAVYQRLVGLLGRMGRLSEAESYLQMLQDQVVASEGITSLDIRLSAGRGQMDRALELARQRAEKQPKDPAAQIWLGQMLVANGKSGEAEAPLLRAAELAPETPAVQGALFGYYLRTKQPDKARKVLRQVAGSKNIKEPQKSLVLAQGHELLEDREQAKACYRQAAAAAPNDSSAQMQLAGFLLRSSRTEDAAEAEKLLRDIIQRWPKLDLARRLLAGILVERGGEPEWQESQRLLGQVSEDPSGSDVDRRLQAVFLLRRGGKDNRERARRLLERLVADPKTATPMDRGLLAGLLEADGRRDEARQQYLALVGRERPRPDHLTAYIEFLLRHGPADEADQQLKALEKLAPEQHATMLLRARWLQAAKRSAEIGPLVEAWAKKLRTAAGKEPEKEALACEAVGSIYAAVEQFAAAEGWYRQAHKAKPARFEPLALVLARLGRTKEAIELCADAAKTDRSARPAMVLEQVLVTGRPAAEEFKRAEAVLSKFAEDHKSEPEILFALASFLLLQGKAEEAAAVYRQAKEAKPGHPVVLNNLATLLSEREETRKEALSLIDEAIRAVGPQAWLQDTKGTILLYAGRAEEAVPLLEEATAVLRPDPRAYLHLAAAYDRTGGGEKAQIAWKNSEKGDLKRQVLTPADQKLVQELEKKYGS